MTAALTWRSKPPHPVLFGVEYPERLSRWKTLLRLILAIPQLIVVYVLQLVFGVLTFIAWFAILFTGRYPRGLFDFNVGVLRWSANVWAYIALLRDEHPPFSTEAQLYPLLLDIPYPERQSRFRLFVRLITILPNQLVFQFFQTGWFFTTIFAWFAILIGGKYPRGIFGFAVGCLRWQVRQQAYLYLLRDEYPPYSLESTASPGNELVSGVIGVPIAAAYVAFFALTSFGSFSADSDTVEVFAPLTSPALQSESPSGSASGVRISLLDYEDPAPIPSEAGNVYPGYRFIAFRVSAEKDGLFPGFFTPFFFRMHDCQGFGYDVQDVSDGFDFKLLSRGGEHEGWVTFQLPQGSQPCDLIYRWTGRVEFLFLGGT